MKVVADFAHRMDLDEMHAFDIWLLMVKNYLEVFNEGDGVFHVRHYNSLRHVRT